MTSSQIIVLGWDALDLELIDEFGLSGQFGTHETTIETYSNPVIDEPHTLELWPSLITGLHPDDHGIHAVDDSDGVNWNNPLLNVASNLANGVVPRSVLTTIGKRLRERGAGTMLYDASYYRENGLETVFDRPGARAISLPNYETDLDRRYELDAHRNTLWKQLQVDRSVESGIKPQVSPVAIQGVMGEALGKRFGQTVSAIHRGDSLVWTWFGAIDSVGHMDPAIDQPLQETWYGVAADVTQAIVEMAPDDATVVSVSDHGLQEGEHTEYATLCADNPEPLEAIDSVFDVAGWIDDELGEAGATEELSFDAVAMEGVTETLEELGYI